MKAKQFLYTAIILLPFFSTIKSKAQNRERHRSVTINQTVVDGKVIASDTIITYTDTTTRTINSKEVSMEMPYAKGNTVYIDNSYRKLNIRQSKNGKVRLVTTTFYYGEPSFTDAQWLEKLNITMKNTDTGMVITSGGITRSSSSSLWGQNGSYYSFQTPAPPEPPTAIAPGTTVTTNGTKKEVKTKGMTVITNGATREVRINGTGTASETVVTGSTPVTTVDIDGWVNSVNSGIQSARSLSSSTGANTAVFDEKGNNVYNSNSLRRELTIYIPAEAKLKVVSKYADVTADHDLKNLHIKISNGSLDMVNADNAVIISTYSNISTGNIENGDISVANGKLSMKNANQLQLNTRYAKVEADKCNVLTVKSVSDDYDIDEVKSLNGTKTYGKLRVDKLTGSLDLKGSSADVRIRNIEPSVSTIALDNKYADIQFPVSNLKNYEVVFSGNYSSVFAPFERRDTTVEKKPEQAVSSSSANEAYTNAATNYRIAVSGQAGSSLSGLSGSGTGNSKRSNGFWATVGDVKGTHTKFNLTCTSCNVDFK